MIKGSIWERRAIQFMLMMLFQLVWEMADDPRGFRADDHRDLAVLVATYKLPSIPADAEQKIRAATRKILDSIMLRSFEPTVKSVASPHPRSCQPRWMNWAAYHSGFFGTLHIQPGLCCFRAGQMPESRSY